MNKIKLLLMAAILVMGNAKINAAWSGSGWGTNQGGTWYAVYDESEQTLNTIDNTKSYQLSAPGKTFSFEAKRGTGAISGHFYAQYSTDNSNWHDLNSSGLSLGTSYKSYSYTLPSDAKYVRCKTKTGATLFKYVKNVKVTMDQYMEDASKSSLNLGAKKLQDAQVSDNFTIAHCNIPAMTYAINNNGGDADAIQDVEVSISDNSQAGYYSTATITVKYTPTHLGTLKANLVITSPGFGSKTIALNGSCSKHDQTVTWTTDSISPLNIGTELDTIATAELDLTFTSSDSTIVNIENGKFIAVATGTAIITASNEGSDYYNPVSSTMEITVNEKEESEPTTLEALTNDQPTATKFFRGGQLYIRKNGVIYTPSGMRY